MGRRRVQRKPVISGIYKIVYRGGIYIGSSNDMYQRFDHHRSKLKNGKHSSREFQREYSTYGGQLKFKIIIECPENMLHYPEYVILRNCEKRGVKLWNSHGRKSLNGNTNDIEYVYACFG